MRLLKVNGSKRLHSTIDIIPSHLRSLLKTLARLPTVYRCSHHVFTPDKYSLC